MGRAASVAEDGLDLTYVKDTGRAIALLRLADRLNHRTYDIGMPPRAVVGHQTVGLPGWILLRSRVPSGCS